MADISTLIEDIGKVLTEGVEEISPSLVSEFGQQLANLIANKITKPKEERKNGLYMSNMGTPCERKLWYTVNVPQADHEELTADAKFKFLYGDIIEATTLFLAKVAGHSVEGTQDVAELHGVRGRRDAVIDGVVIDVKSTSTFSFNKFKEHTLSDDDPFGYIPQLMGYLEVAQSDDLVAEKTKAAFLAIDKTLGHMVLDWHEKPNWNWEEVIEHKRTILKSETPPDRAFLPEEDGYKNKDGEFKANGNKKLGRFCSYCSAKELCHPGLRTFLSSSGPKYFTEIVKEPKMFEVKKNADTGGT